MAYGRQLYTTPSSAIDAGVIYDQTEAKMQSEINALLKDQISKSFTLTGIDDAALATNTDLNTVVAVGNYKGTSGSYSNRPDNVATAFTLRVFSPTGNLQDSYLGQIYIPVGATSHIAYRVSSNSGSSWSTWRQLMYVSDMTDTYVRRTGDTVTGPFAVKSTNITHDSYDPTSNLAGDNRIYLQDVNGVALGYLMPYITTAGLEGLNIRAIRTVGSTTASNWLSLFINSSGESSVAFSDTSAWKKALGLGTSGTGPITIDQGGTGATSAADAATNLSVLKLSGGTLTGSINVKSSNITVGTVPSGNTLGDHKMIVSDIGGTTIGYISPYFTPSGGEGIMLRANKNIGNSSTHNYLLLTVDQTGNRGVAFSDAGPWREALGLGTSGALPITIAQGGTGSTAVEKTTNSTGDGIATASSGFQITGATYAEWGKIAQITLTIKATTASTGNSVDVCTLNAGKRPMLPTQNFTTADANLVVFGTNGTVTVYKTFAANTSCSIRGIYLLP